MSAVHFYHLIVDAAVSHGVTFKPLCIVYTLGINSDNLEASCYTNLQFCWINHISVYCVFN